MRDDQLGGSKMQRALGDLVLVEMFLLQASIESATAIGSGMQQLGRQLSGESQPGLPDLTELIQRTAEDAIEPFTSRLTFLRNWHNRDI